MAMDRSTTHEMLARPNAEETSRLQYIVELKQRLRGYSGGMRRVFDKRASALYAERHGHAPANRHEIADSMASDPFYQSWSAVSRSAQDLMWTAVETTILRDLPRMKAAARDVAAAPAGGSLNLPNSFVAPADAYVADIHGQLGGYMRDEAPDDIIAGALYESGGNAFSSGAGIGGRDSKAAAVIAFLAKTYPDLKPKRILDLGCSAGGASVAYADHFPDAEVHAVDVGVSMLRYAHARAEHLGVAVHFHLMDAAKLSFEDASFDLVVSHNMMHEVSEGMLGEIFKEAHRVLKPGGVVVHQDVPVRGADFTTFDQFMFSWQTRNNDEPFWDDFVYGDVMARMAEAGFGPDEARELTIPMLDGPRFWYLVLGEKPLAAA